MKAVSAWAVCEWNDAVRGTPDFIISCRRHAPSSTQIVGCQFFGIGNHSVWRMSRQGASGANRRGPRRNAFHPKSETEGKEAISQNNETPGRTPPSLLLFNSRKRKQ